MNSINEKKTSNNSINNDHMNDLIQELLEYIKSRNQPKCIHILNQLSKCEGFDVNAQINEESLLIKVFYHNLLDVAKHIIEALHADPNKQQSDGWTALHYAVWLNKPDMVNYLIGVPGVDPNKQTYKCKYTALNRAVYWNRKECVEALLKSNHLDTSLCDCYGRTEEEFARCDGYYDIADMIACHEPGLTVLDNK